MSLFQQATTTLTEAKAQIADSAGVSGDTEMLTRAGRAYAAAIRHFNNLAQWNVLRIENPAIPVIAPFQVTGCTYTSGTNVITTSIASGFTIAGVTALDLISGSGMPHDLQVSAIASAGASSLTANLTASATITGTLTFSRDLYDLPSDLKQIYTVRLLTLNRSLGYVGRRVYDRQFGDQSIVGSPEAYDLFRWGDVGKIRLVPPPQTADSLKIRYYRRMDKNATPIDVHDDWEPYFIAWAKWWFLNDKGGTPDRAQNWLTFANTGIQAMLKENVTIPDESLAFTPGTMEGLNRQTLNPIYHYEDWLP